MEKIVGSNEKVVNLFKQEKNQSTEVNTTEIKETTDEDTTTEAAEPKDKDFPTSLFDESAIKASKNGQFALDLFGADSEERKRGRTMW